MHLEFFGRRSSAGWYDSEAMRSSRYYIPRQNWRVLVDILVVVVDPRLAPFWVAAILGGVADRAFSRSRRLQGWVWAFSALALVQIAMYWLLIPYRTQQRFMLQGLGLGVVPLARLLDRGGGSAGWPSRRWPPMW